MKKPTNAELKLTVAKLIEIAYSQDKGKTISIVMGKEPFKLSVDANGNAALSSKVGILTFDGSEALEQIGLSIRALNVRFSNQGDGDVGYTASFDFKAISIGVSGTFNIEQMITACSGWLCQAARHLKGFDSNIDAQMQQIMGH